MLQLREYQEQCVANVRFELRLLEPYFIQGELRLTSQDDARTVANLLVILRSLRETARRDRDVVADR